MFKKQGYLVWIILGIAILVVLWQTNVIEHMDDNTDKRAVAMSTGPPPDMPMITPDMLKGIKRSPEDEISSIKRQIELIENRITELDHKVSDLGSFAFNAKKRLRM